MVCVMVSISVHRWKKRTDWAPQNYEAKEKKIEKREKLRGNFKTV